MLKINKLNAKIDNKEILKEFSLKYKSWRSSRYNGPKWIW